MRLTDQEVTGILKAAEACAQNAEVYLYGSRVDDAKRGGDIDLLFVFPDDDPVNIFQTKINLAVALETELGERRIDITTAFNRDLTIDPFLISIIKNAVRL